MTDVTETPAHRRRALVTGASSGIGRALAEQLVEHGYDVVLAADDDAVQDVAAELDERGCEVSAVQVDLSTHDGVEELNRRATLGGPLQVAALNAGIANGGEFAGSELDRDLQLVDLNCRSTVHLAKLVLPGMVQEGEGALLFTSSIAAAAPGPYHATYGASKAFVQSFAHALRHELRDTGVTVTTVLPGPTDTEIFERGGMESTAIAQGRKDDPADVAKDAIEAMQEGRAEVIIGPVTNKAQVAAAKLLPDPLAAAVAARQTKPGSGT
jgi:short-subunit dehydrogenase